MDLLKRLKYEELEHALEETTYQLVKMVSDDKQQRQVQEIVERNLKVLDETYEELVENTNKCRQ